MRALLLTSPSVTPTLRLPPKARALAAALLAATLGATLGCPAAPTPEQAMRKVLDAGAAALGKGDVAAAGDLLSDAYRDGAGRDKRTMKQIAFVALRQGPVRVVYRDVSIQVEGERGTATLQAFVVQGQAEVASLEDLLPQNARQLALTVSFAKEGDEWRVISIEGDGLRSPL